MKRKQGPILTAVLVDYDNIYLALRRKNEDAAKRFAKDAGSWLKEIESGQLITPTNSVFGNVNRRIVLNRCYGNPVPRRNTHDNSTDMYSFPFVRHHFLRSGFEVVDCPPLTAQLKNSSDIRMVMDVRDYLMHDTYFDEFIILSGDADFTPVLHRLRAHARRTVIFANDHTAVPYKAISDGEVREIDLIQQLAGSNQIAQQPATSAAAIETTPAPLQIEDQRRAIVEEVIAAVRASRHAIPLDLLSERVVRILGHEQTTGSNWVGTGSFRALLTSSLPEGIVVGEQPPYLVIDAARRLAETQRRAELTSESHDRLARSPSPLIAGPMPAAAPTQAVAVEGEVAIPVAQQAPIAPPPPPVTSSTAASALGGLFRSVLPSLSTPAPTPATPPASNVPLAQQVMEEPAAPAFTSSTMMPQLSANPAPQKAAVQAAYPSLPQGFGPLMSQPMASMNAPSLPPAPPAPPAYAELRYEPRNQHVALPPAPPVQQQAYQQAPAAASPPASAQRAPDVASASTLQQSIARIHEACQAPPLSPPEYRVLFDAMAREITERGLAGSQTLANIVQRAQEQGVDVRRDDVRFVLEVVSETDPWFEQGASSTLFAGRFRNFVVARCRSQGLNLSVDELDLIEAWFVAGAPPVVSQPAVSRPLQAPASVSADQRAADALGRSNSAAYQQQMFAPANAPGQVPAADEEFPRIVRTRLRG
jgi:hypothetical protein